MHRLGTFRGLRKKTRTRAVPPRVADEQGRGQFVGQAGVDAGDVSALLHSSSIFGGVGWSFGNSRFDEMVFSGPGDCIDVYCDNNQRDSSHRHIPTFTGISWFHLLSSRLFAVLLFLILTHWG